MLTIDLDGIDDDGSPLVPGVPARAGAYFEVPINADATIRVRCRHPDGTPACIGSTARLQAKRRPNRYDEAVIDINAVVDRDGIATMTLPKAQTKDRDAGRYIYDCWATAAGTGATTQIIPPQQCLLRAGNL